MSYLQSKILSIVHFYRHIFKYIKDIHFKCIKWYIWWNKCTSFFLIFYFADHFTCWFLPWTFKSTWLRVQRNLSSFCYQIYLYGPTRNSNVVVAGHKWIRVHVLYPVILIVHYYYYYKAYCCIYLFIYFVELWMEEWWFLNHRRSN